MSNATNNKPFSRNTEYEGINFSFRDLKGANLSGTTFTKCNFTEAQLEGANLEGCEFIDCNFTEAQLDCANLEGCEFNECNFEKVVFYNEEWRDAVFVACTPITCHTELMHSIHRYL